MKREVPLEPGNAHLSFRVTLSGTPVQVFLDWVTRGDYYTVRVDGPGGTLVAGAGLHPQMDLLADVPEITGRLFIEGPAPSVDNLGREARLVYET